MANAGSDTPRATTTDAHSSDLQQLIARRYKSMNKLINFYNGQLHDELTSLMSSMKQEHPHGRMLSEHSSQLTDALDLKCSAGFDNLSHYVMCRPSCSSLDLDGTSKLRQL